MNRIKSSEILRAKFNELKPYKEDAYRTKDIADLFCDVFGAGICHVSTDDQGNPTSYYLAFFPGKIRVSGHYIASRDGYTQPMGGAEFEFINHSPVTFSDIREFYDNIIEYLQDEDYAKDILPNNL